MFNRRKRASTQLYSAPKQQVHRSFFYLDDDVVINSLSALESGKVDEVVEKINLAQERGLSIGVRAGTTEAGVTGDASRKGSESLQAEVIRRRTRFSVFELWHEALMSKHGIGSFRAWGSEALDGVIPGQMVEITGRIDIVPLQVGLRLYLWWLDEVRNENPLLSKGVKLEDQILPERTIRFLLGKRDEVNATVAVDGSDGPTIALSFSNEWVIEPVGRWNGTFTIIAQVEEVLAAGETWQTMRITENSPLTPLEQTTLKTAVEAFRPALKGLGIDLDETPTQISGPAVILHPIAMYR